MPPKKFSDGEKVLCYHGPMMYEAKCMRGQIKEKAMQYLIHYNGWNKSWDEWVPEARVLKHNDANLQKQKELLQQGKGNKKRRGGADRSLAEKHDKLKKGEMEPPRKRRRGDISTMEDDTSSKTTRPLVIVLPDNIKKWLSDESDLVNKQKQLVELPHCHSIVSVLEDFKKTLDSDAKEHGIASEICVGLVEYFNVLLGTQLLYKFERAQYADLVADKGDTPVAQLYGPEHLLRMFVRLGSVLSHTAMDEQSSNLLLRHMHNVLKFISDNATKYLSADRYHAPAPEYHRKLS